MGFSKRIYKILLTLFICQAGYVSACDDEEPCCIKFLPINKLNLGPEIYYLERERDGGSKQKGMMYGVRGSYERLKRYKWYLGVEGFYGIGKIKGHTKLFKLKSTMQQESIEGRFGYTFQAKNSWKPAFTPFIGYGYYRESNQYHSPTPLKLKFINDYTYLSYGFLSSIAVSSCVTIGANAKFRSMYDPKCRVKKDPDADDTKMLIEDKLQYRLEFPICYHFYVSCFNAEIGIVPFFERQHYGGRENFPNNFYDTKLWLYGANIQFIGRF